MSQIKLTADSGGGTTSLKAPSSTTSNADVVLKLPVADGSANQVLKTDGSGQLSFTSNAGTTINNNADNRVITGSGTANTLNGESGLTFDGNAQLKIAGSGQQDLIIGSTDANGAAIALDGDSNGDATGSDYAVIRHNTDGNLEITTRNPSGATATIFKQGTTESLRIDSSGRVMIGTTSTSGISSNADDLIIGSIGDNTARGLTFATTDAGSIRWADAGDNAMGRIQYANNSDVMTFHTSNATRMRLDSDGMKFGSDSAAANALNDYEEGSWTPAVYDGNGSNYVVTVATNETYYTKIGRLVTLMFNITNAENGSKTSDLYIPVASFPFTPAVGTQNGTFWVDHGGPTTGLGDIIGGIMNVGSSGAWFTKPSDESGMGYSSSRYLQHGQWSYGRPIYGCFQYITS